MPSVIAITVWGLRKIVLRILQKKKVMHHNSKFCRITEIIEVSVKNNFKIKKAKKM